MSKKMKNRILALAIALLMVVQILPASLLAVEAADNVHVLDATADLTAFEAGAKADGESEKFHDYFTVHYSAKNKVDGSSKTFDDGYSATQRLNFGGKSSIGSTITNAIEFTTSGAAAVKIWWVSGGDGRSFAIYDANGSTLTTTDPAASVKNSLYISELNVEAAGTYYLGLPEGSNYLFKLEVTENASGSDEGGSAGNETVTSTYTFDATTLTAAADKEAVEAGTAFAEGYFTSFGKLTKRTKSEAVFCVELEKKNAGGLTFTVTGTADVTVWISSTGGSNTSTFNLLDANGVAVADKDGNATPEVTGTTFIEVSYKALPAGTYQVASPSTDRNTRLSKVVVVETTAGSAEPEATEAPTEPAAATSWDFTSDDYTGQNPYNGLSIAGGASKHGATYGMNTKNSTISVPVSGPCYVTVYVGYNWDITFPDGTNESFPSGDGGKMVPLTYNHTGGAGTVDIVVGDVSSYIAKIELGEVKEEEKPATSWDFTSDDYTGQNPYNGLSIAGGASKHGATYGMNTKNSTISVPVSGPCSVTVYVGYNWDITFPDGTNESFPSGDGGKNVPLTYNHTGGAGTVDIVVGDVSSYIAKIELGELVIDEAPEYSSDKVYVWDFGAAVLDAEKYNNMLTVDEINSWFADVAAGTTGVNLASFTTANGLLSFNDGGYPTTHRLRTTNAALTRYDDKSLKDADGNVYNGYVYSNKSEPGVYFTLKVTAGDIVTLVVGSNGKADSDITFEAPSGAKTTKTHLLAGAKAQLLTFYATETGTYKIYCSTAAEKLVLARIYLEHNNTVTVSGKVNAPAALTGYKLLFTNTASGATVEAAVENGAYSVELTDNYTYSVSLVDANGYIITGTDSLTLTKGAGNATLDLTVIAVDLVTITGTITGLSDEALAKLQLKLVSDGIYIPEFVINGNTYTVKAEVGRTYTLVAEGVNDYALGITGDLVFTEDLTAEIPFSLKPTYAVTIAPQGCTLADLANATFTFTNLHEEGYVYTFVGTDNIALRDGTYTVTVTGAGNYVAKATSNLTVNGGAVTKAIAFEVPTSWDFSASDFAGTSPYNGLTFTNGQKNKTYLLHGAGTISVPVNGTCKIVVSACYQYSFYFKSATETSVDQNTNSTNQIDTFEYLYTGEAGTVDITVLGTSYITKIEVVDVVAYKDTLTVGASGCDYTTIGDALDAIRAMDRTADQRVTVMIQPGDYEEMLVVDVPNVTLKNASETPSIGLTDQGVGIEANAVRITWYYGHGYNYYSMGSDYKFDAETLAINKANGYLTTANPGSGTGTYWNASVVIAADGFSAEGIIFENSFNQYMSKAAANDIIVKNDGAKEGTTPRSEMTVGSVLVQDKKYVERAAALAIADGCKNVYFENCKFVGRQDTLYGGHDATVAFYGCSIYGSTDYIFGGMTAVFAKCDLVFNTSEDKNDVGYITAAQTKDGHGLLMYNCTVTSTTPGVDTASQYTSKPGYFGRPWTPNTGEAVFFHTVIDATCNHFYDLGASLINPAGWLSTLSGESALSAEYGTYEYAKDVDNSGNRVSWATVLPSANLANGEPISVETWLGSWDPFAGKDMTIETPDGKIDNSTQPDDGEDPTEPEATEPPASGDMVESTITLNPSNDLPILASGEKAKGETMTIHDFFTVIFGEKTKVDGSSKTFSDGFSGSFRLNFQSKTDTADMSCTVKFTTTSAATIKIWWVSGGDGRNFAIYNEAGEIVATTTDTSIKNELYISTLELAAAGTYYLGVPDGSNNLYRLDVTMMVPDDSGDTDPTEPEATEPEDDGKLVLDAGDMDQFAAGDKADGDTLVIDGFFTLHLSAKSKVEAKVKTFSDGYTGTQRFSLGGATDVANGMLNSVEFTADGATTLKIWWVGGGEGRYIAIYDANGNIVASTELCAEKDDLHISELTLKKGGKYYIGMPEGNNYLFRVEATVSEEPSAPQTGDSSMVSLAIALMLASAAAVVILPRKKFF